VKRAGVPAYRAARAGNPLELDARTVIAFELELVETRAVGATTEADIEIACGKGFYVRSLAHDLGQALGLGGHVSSLCRTAVGHFRIEDAVPLERALALLESGEHETLVHAPDSVIADWPALIVGPASVIEVREGRDVRPPPQAIRRVGRPGEQARAYGPDGRLIALLEATPLPGAWHPYRVFPR
jgi:tRNA pseudouridine55 synthase